MSFRRCDWLFPPSAREVSPGNRSNYKSTRERVDSKGLYGRWRLHLMGSWVYLLVLETKKKHALFLPFLSPLSPSLSWIKAHIRYIKILTWLSRGFRVKIANFSWLHCLPIPRRDLSTKKTRLRACLHGVGDPGLVGLVSFVFTLWGTQNKRNLPH